VIHVFGTPDPPVARLLAAVGARHASVGAAGHSAPAAAAGGSDGDEFSTLVLGPGVPLDELALGVLLGAWRRASRPRVLVMSLVGAHPDARAERLRQLWRIEEWARSTALPVLTLRLAPLVGPESPLWLKLCSRPRLSRAAQRPLNPVDEADVTETLTRALDGRARWEGWYELAGPEPLSLEDLAHLARDAGPSLGRASGRGEWEPPLAELEEHRLSECEPWARHFGLSPGAITSRVREWSR
jgi:uncharacterized protein YbjT (DUF2867 family)